MILFDLHHLAYRAAYAHPYLSHNGKLTGVAFGVIGEIKSCIDRLEDTNVVIACDSPTSKRKEIFPSYKNRPLKTEDDRKAKELMIEQINDLKSNIFPRMGVCNVFEYDGYEADDILAEIVMRRNWVARPVIVTGDEDIFQLLDHADIWMSNKQKMWTNKKFENHYKIPVAGWVEYKTLAGCTSDTVPGVSGVGPVYAIQHIKNELKPGKIMNFITEAKNDGTYEKMQLLVKLPFPKTPISTIRKTNFDKEAFLEICDEYGFNSFKRNVCEWAVIFK